MNRRNVAPPLTPINRKAGMGANERVEKPSAETLHFFKTLSEVEGEWIWIQKSFAELAVTWNHRPRFLESWATDTEIIRQICQPLPAVLAKPKCTGMSAFRASLREYVPKYSANLRSRLISDLRRISTQNAKGDVASEFMTLLDLLEEKAPTQPLAAGARRVAK